MYYIFPRQKYNFFLLAQCLSVFVVVSVTDSVSLSVSLPLIRSSFSLLPLRNLPSIKNKSLVYNQHTL